MRLEPPVNTNRHGSNIPVGLFQGITASLNKYFHNGCDPREGSRALPWGQLRHDRSGRPWPASCQNHPASAAAAFAPFQEST